MIAATFAIRAATEIERRKLGNALFPRSAESTADIMVASAADGRPPLGAAAVWYAPSREFPEHANLGLHVLEPHRRQGIGRALLENMADVARKTGAGELRGQSLQHASAGFLFAMACGFEAQPATIDYEAPIEDYIRALAPVYERLVKRKRMPPDAKVIPLKEANREEVCRLIMDNLGFPSQSLADRLRGTEHGFSQTISRVALLDGRMVGAILMTFQKAVASVVGTAVIPQHRYSWVNVALKYHVMQEVIARDVRWGRFSANEERHRDTANFARRINARVLGKISAVILHLNREQ